MPPGIRIRANNVFGTVADNPLAPASTVFNSNQLVLLPQVAGDHAIITLDPIRQFGDPEIVVVTAHAAAATVATITRGAYGTAAREHPFETVWTHAAVDEDWIEIVGNPSIDILEPYRNQLAWDSNDSLQRFDGSNWGIYPQAATAQVFTSNGTWNKPTGLRFVRVRVIGGGGAGGGTVATGAGQAAEAGGGGGGGYSEKIIAESILGASVAVTVGAGASPPGSGNSGGSGFTSSFGAHCSATGGLGGLVGSASAAVVNPRNGGSGGTGAGGDVNTVGEAGSYGQTFSGNRSLITRGGGSALAGGVRAAAAGSSPGSAGSFPGGGGSGGFNGPSTGGQDGGAGAAGVVIVEEYY